MSQEDPFAPRSIEVQQTNQSKQFDFIDGTFNFCSVSQNPPENPHQVNPEQVIINPAQISQQKTLKKAQNKYQWISSSLKKLFRIKGLRVDETRLQDPQTKDLLKSLLLKKKALNSKQIYMLISKLELKEIWQAMFDSEFLEESLQKSVDMNSGRKDCYKAAIQQLKREFDENHN